MNVRGSFGSWLKQRRKALDLTQADLADQVGCAVATVQKIEHDARRPSKQVAARMADVLAIAIEERDAFLAFARRVGRPASMPAPPVQDAPTHHLPPQATRFIGREPELRAIAERLANPVCRLLALIGPGGMGKTRLALQAAAEQTAHFVHGVYFVSLAQVNAPGFIAPAIGSVLPISFQSADQPKVQLIRYLREKSMLLVLDNLEHLLEGIDVLADLLINCPGLKIVATSRVRLNLQEEWVLPIGGLPFPDGQLPDHLDSYAAVRLFVQSASKIVPDFSLADDDNSVVTICRAVEGMPLAIELAASWVQTMPCRQIAAHIRQNLDFLETPTRNVEKRHRSLRAVCDHSWNLLSDVEHGVLAKLSVFRGGADLEAAEQVADATLPVLRSLVDKSWVRVNATERYDLHELLRQFAADKLFKSGGEATTAAQHLGIFLTLAVRAESHLADPQRTEWLDRLEIELDNLRTALDWAYRQGQFEAGLHLAGALAEFWLLRGHWTEGRDWLERFLAISNTSLEARSKALSYLAYLTSTLGDNLRAKELGEESLALARQTGNKLTTAWAFCSLAYAVSYLRDYAPAEGLYEQALSLFRATQNRLGIGRTLHRLGRATLLNGNVERGIALLEEGLALGRRTGYQEIVAWTLYDLGNIRCSQGHDPKQTEALYQESMQLWHAMRSTYGESRALWGLATVAQMQGDAERVQAFGQESLVLNQEIGNQGGMARSLDTLGIAARMRGDFERSLRLHIDSLLKSMESGNWLVGLVFPLGELGKLAAARQQPYEAAKLIGAVDDLYSVFSRLYPCNLIEFGATLQAVRAELGEEEYKAAYSEGRSMTIEQAIAYVLDNARSS